jgi:hypothetical protein
MLYFFLIVIQIGGEEISFVFCFLFFFPLCSLGRRPMPSDAYVHVFTSVYRMRGRIYNHNHSRLQGPEATGRRKMVRQKEPRIFRVVFEQFRTDVSFSSMGHDGSSELTIQHRVQKLLKLAELLSSRTYVLRRTIPEDFVCHESRIVLTGEAAHPLLVLR